MQVRSYEMTSKLATQKVHHKFRLFFITTALCVFNVTFAQPQLLSATGCGPLRTQGQYGPYDYRTDKDKLPIVLGAHFTPEVEALIRGKNSTFPGNDIDYTLRAIPNNHRALIAMMRLGDKEKTPQPRGSRYTVECWFERAIQFRPDDSIVRMIYSTFLNKKVRVAEANAQLETATTYARDSAVTHHNIGMHFFDIKNYERALSQAHRAIALGLERPELKDQLAQIGKWKDPVQLPFAIDSNSQAPQQPQ
jgi:tetratricopeptide (TPR) repeat protein